jgi:hypothetical protein
LPDSIEAVILEIFENAESLTNSTVWGIVIDLREEQEENAFDSMRLNSESVSNENNESALQN